MSYNINFQISALIIVVLLLHHFMTQKKLHNANTKIFTYVLILSGIYILFDLISTLSIMRYEPAYENKVLILLTAVYLFDIMLPYILYCCAVVSREQGKKIDGVSVICTVVTVIMLILMLINLTSGWFFYFDQSTGYHRGSGYVMLYIYVLLYIVLVIHQTLKKREDLNVHKMGGLAEIVVIEGLCMGVELYTQHVMLSGFGLALGLVFLYLTMNNPGDFIDSTTGVFDKQYFDNWIQEKLDKRTEFHLIAVEAFMLKQINKVYGSSVGDQLLVQIARELQGLIAQIGLLQLRRVCRFIKDNEHIMDSIRNVKFNLSPSELLKPGHSQVLIDIIKEFGLSPAYFQFEITETVATEYSESFCKAVEDFQNAGIGLCLDDFGSGYANLSAVLKLPFDVVKMDRSLLTGITCDEQAANFYRSIVMVMQNMGYMIVAEGAETEEEVNLLRSWGVDMVQGYYFSRPLPEKELLKLF